MHYVRIYTDDRGDSHFEDVKLPTRQLRSPVSSARTEVTDPIDAVEAVFRRVVVDHPPAPHPAPRRQLIIHLRGEAEVEVSDGEIRRFGAGSVVLVEDMTGEGHATRRVGDTPRETLMIALDDRPDGSERWTSSSLTDSPLSEVRRADG